MKFLLLLFLVPKFIFSEQCDLVIANNKFSALYGNDELNLIYNKGVISNDYARNSKSPHISPEQNGVSYLFASSQIKETDLNIKVASNDTKITNPQHTTVKDESEVMTQIEIIYHCENPGTALITLSFQNVKNCGSFDLIWVKKCDNNIAKNMIEIPKINLGFKKGSNDIIKEGEIQSEYQSLFDKKLKFLIENDILHFFISSPFKELNFISPFHISSQNKNLVNARVLGEVSKGGLIDSNEKEFFITFDCSYKSLLSEYTSEVQLDLPFENKYVLTLYITKLCPIVKESFSTKAIRFLFLVTVLTLFFILFALYYFEIDLTEFNLKKITNEISGKFKDFMITYLNLPKENILTYEKDKDEDNETSQMNTNDEEEALNVQYIIKTKSDEAIDLSKGKDYGGI